DRIGAFRAEEIDDSRPEPGELYAAGIFGGQILHRLGIFAALDMRTNELVGRQHGPEECYGGSVAPAGGLVFVGRNDGRLTALDSSDGRKLWEFQTGAGMNAPASVFEHRGKQYVVAYSAGNPFQGSARGDSVWLFGLDGGLDPVPPAGAIMSFSPAVTGDPDLDRGKTVFDTACMFCHGEVGEGGHGGGPSLATARNRATVLQVVSEGRNTMPPFNGSLTPEEIRDVSAYVTDRLAE